MTFTHPAFLYALSLLLIPVVIHFFSVRRRKTVVFSNVAMLSEVKRANSNTQNLRHWLILISRMLFLAALILAFAGPYLSNQKQENHTSEKILIIDNHPGMMRSNGSTSLIDELKQFATSWVLLSEPNSVFYTFTQNYRSFAGANASKTVEKINGLDISYQVASLNALTDRAVSGSKSAKDIFVYSDFRKGRFQLDIWGADTLNNYYLMPLFPPPAINFSLDTCFFTQPVRSVTGEDEISFLIRSDHEKAEKEVAVRLYIGEELSGIATVEIPAGKTIEGKIRYTVPNSNFVAGKIEVDDGADLHDNVLYFAYENSRNSNILAIYQTDSSQTLSRLYRDMEGVRFSHIPITEINPGNIQNASVIIFHKLNKLPSGIAGQIKERAGNPPVLCFFPSTDSPEASNQLLLELGLPVYTVSDTLPLFLNQIAYEDPFYRDVFLNKEDKIRYPEVKPVFHLDALSGATPIPLIFGPSGQALLYRLAANGFQALMWTVSLDSKALAEHALFAVSMVRLAHFNPTQVPLYVEPGGIFQFASKTAAQNKTFVIKGDQMSFMPEMLPGSIIKRFRIYAEPLFPGNYSLMQGDSLQAMLAINASRSANSGLGTGPEELKQIIDASGYRNMVVIDAQNREEMASISVNLKKKLLWPLFIWAALAFLAIEIILIQFWRR
jgi:hypothetical protein